MGLKDLIGNDWASEQYLNLAIESIELELQSDAQVSRGRSIVLAVRALPFLYCASTRRTAENWAIVFLMREPATATSRREYLFAVVYSRLEGFSCYIDRAVMLILSG